MDMRKLLQAAAFVLLLLGVLQNHVGAVQVFSAPSRRVDGFISQALETSEPASRPALSLGRRE
jgi:hypothetical protein